jgi:hypothetical protein
MNKMPLYISDQFKGLRGLWKLWKDVVNIVENQGMGVQEPDESYITPLRFMGLQKYFF